MMRIFILATFLLLNSCANSPFVANSDKKNQSADLQLVASYEVETLGKLEPSGLTLWGGKFYTVSDKDNFIFELEFTDNKVRLIPFLEIENDKPDKLDFEGITHDDEFFYLISELHFQILKISRDGQIQQWIPEDDRLRKAGQEAGLFTTHNAYFEGVCLLSNGNFLLAAERQPRGFVEYDDLNNRITAYQQNDAILEYPSPRSPDFAGLSCSGEDMYVLNRNANAISRIINIDGKYKGIKAYSFEDIINSPDYQYNDMTYGTAEGLVVDQDKVYIILDNNRDSFKTDSDNNNSLFIELKL